MSDKAYITFTLGGQTHEYDGGLPPAVLDRAAALLTPEGFWIGGYPPGLEAQAVDLEDVLPIARWEIEHVGGVIKEIHGARPNGAIHQDDWKQPRIH